MNKATLNRRNRERRAKRKERERSEPSINFNDQLPDAEFVPQKVTQSDDDISTEELLAQIEDHIASLGLDESDQKSLGTKLESTAKELKKPEKKKDKDSSVESALTAPTGSDVDAFGRPAVSAAVEEALEEEPMEFMVDDPVDVPVDDLSQVDRLSSMFASNNFLSGVNPVQAGAIQESAARAGLDGPVDEETQAEFDAADLMEEIRVLEGLRGPQAEARLMDIYNQLEAERQKPTSRSKQGSSDLINRRTGDLFYFPSLFKGRRGVLNTVYVDQILKQLEKSPAIRRLTARRPALGMRPIAAR
tara:strand:- start:7640 stop:8551 length:912 start_codon:yes stop_codon:yes gene_type:complete